jgi:hypothetical protein
VRKERERESPLDTFIHTSHVVRSYGPQTSSLSHPHLAAASAVLPAVQVLPDFVSG